MEAIQKVTDVFETHQALDIQQKYENLLRLNGFMQKMSEAIEEFGALEVQQADHEKLILKSIYDFDYLIGQNKKQLKGLIGEEELNGLIVECETLRSSLVKIKKDEPTIGGGAWWSA